MRWGVAVCVLVSLGACAPSAEPPTASFSPSASPSVVETPAPSAAPSPTPTPGTVTKAERFATRLTQIDRDFNGLVEVWLKEAGGKPRGAKFNELKVLGLRKQKRMRILVRKEDLSRKVLKLLPSGLRLETERNIRASRELYNLTQPVKPPVDMPTTRPEGPKKLLRHYAEAERRFDVPWSILASINLIESRMGRLTGPSSAGALGPMQFMPATWDAYGKGSPFKPYNAIMAAGRYLSASGAPERMRSALWNYNHSDYYVDAVLAYHRQMANEPKDYYSYYFWQVFVRTTKGDLQLTGPGRVRCSRSSLC